MNTFIFYNKIIKFIIKNTNKFIKDYDAPQAFTKQTHPLMHHIVEKGVLYQVTFSIARNPVVFAKKYTLRPKTTANWQQTDHQKLFYPVSLYI